MSEVATVLVLYTIQRPDQMMSLVTHHQETTNSWCPEIGQNFTVQTQPNGQHLTDRERPFEVSADFRKPCLSCDFEYSSMVC